MYFGRDRRTRQVPTSNVYTRYPKVGTYKESRYLQCTVQGSRKLKPTVPRIYKALDFVLTKGMWWLGWARVRSLCHSSVRFLVCFYRALSLVNMRIVNMKSRSIESTAPGQCSETTTRDGERARGPGPRTLESGTQPQPATYSGHISKAVGQVSDRQGRACQRTRRTIL